MADYDKYIPPLRDFLAEINALTDLQLAPYPSWSFMVLDGFWLRFKVHSHQPNSNRLMSLNVHRFAFDKLADGTGVRLGSNAKSRIVTTSQAFWRADHGDDHTVFEVSPY